VIAGFGQIGAIADLGKRDPHSLRPIKHRNAVPASRMTSTLRKIAVSSADMTPPPVFRYTPDPNLV
jgi:hypothetical protein